MYAFRAAIAADAVAITQLVNAAYRGDSSRRGWTHEADLIDGLRTTPTDVAQMLASATTMMLLGVHAEELIASICLQHTASATHIGMFVVQPALQAQGLGKRLLAMAENLAQQTWATQKLQMQVITRRHELIAFYERRGYVRTGVISAFPENPEVWQPKLADLQFELLEKIITQASR